MITAAQRVLLVDDEIEIADMLRLFFEAQGYIFIHAADGEQAQRLAPRVMPHAILMDIGLPDTDGYTLAAWLRTGPRTAHIPLLFASQWNDRDNRLTGLGMGAEDFIGKPYDLQELLLRLQNSISHAARTHLTDLRTGLPAAFHARRRLADARIDPARAIVEIELKQVIAYCNTYGSAAGADVHRTVGGLLLDMVNRHGEPDDFLGYLDEDQYVVITSPVAAYALAKDLGSRFDALSGDFYREMKPPVGGNGAGESRPDDRLRLACRITVGEASAGTPPMMV